MIEIATMGSGTGRRTARTWGRVPLMLCVLLVALPVAAEEEVQPRVTMHEVFAAITQLLPLALNEEKFSDPAERERVAQLLDSLALAVEHLNDHAEDRDQSFQFLSRSLGSAVEEARARFKLGQRESARFFVIDATGKCIACHSRLPSDRDFPMARQLTEKIDFDSLSTSDRARMLVVTRSFDEAMKTWEALFRDPDVSPATFDFGGDLLDYLTIALRVQLAHDRARDTLAHLDTREDLPAYLAENIDAWVASLVVYDSLDALLPVLERARALVRPTPGQLEGGQERMVDDLLGSGLLLRFLDSPDHSNADRAEAFYLLGYAEARTIEAFWEPQAEFHLEMAIRLNPRGPFAKDAFALLKNQLELGYGGSSGVHLPTDVRTTLDELGVLLDEPEAQTPAK